MSAVPQNRKLEHRLVPVLRVMSVEVCFVGVPPAEPIARASGVGDVRVDGPVLRCTVCGSFQPFLEALLGHEVVSLSSTPLVENE